MPDTTEHPAYKIARDCIQLITLMFCFYTANVGSRNQDKIVEVEKKQTEVAVKQDVAAENAERVKENLDGKLKEDTQARGVQLYSTWRYLDDVANASGQKIDKDKALESKRLYDAHIQKHGAH